jgi:hypothetical protein
MEGVFHFAMKNLLGHIFVTLGGERKEKFFHSLHPKRDFTDLSGYTCICSVY